MRFCGAVARAPLIGVKFGGFDERLIGSRSKMGKLQNLHPLALMAEVLVECTATGADP